VRSHSHQTYTSFSSHSLLLFTLQRFMALPLSLSPISVLFKIPFHCLVSFGPSSGTDSERARLARLLLRYVPFARAKIHTSGEAKLVASSEAKLARAGKEDAGPITTSTGARSSLGRLGQACTLYGKRTKPRLPTRLPRIIRTSVTLADT